MPNAYALRKYAQQHRLVRKLCMGFQERYWTTEFVRRTPLTRALSSQRAWQSPIEQIPCRGNGDKCHMTAGVDGEEIRREQSVFLRRERRVSSINPNLPFLNQSYRRNLACSLARLLEDHGVPTLLWGDLLHSVFTLQEDFPHEYSFIVHDHDLLNAHDILKNAGFERCLAKGCYLTYENLDAPAAHYHFERPASSWPAYSMLKDFQVANDPDKEFEELETIRLYRREDTVWEITNFETLSGGVSASDGVQQASDTGLEEGYQPGAGRWPTNWPKVRIPMAHKYLEALLLLWVRFKDTEKEIYWFSKFWDMATTSGYQVFNRMERHCRHLAMSMSDHGDLTEKYPQYYSTPELRDILLQAERLLRFRAAGPLYHDPRGQKCRKTSLMPPRYPDGNPGNDHMEDSRLKAFPYLEENWRSAKPFLEEDRKKIYEYLYNNKPEL